MSETRYLFIDGAYLRKELEDFSKEYFRGIRLPIDIAKIARHGSYRKIFYYDCLPPKNSGENSDQYQSRCKPVQEEFDAMREVPGVHVVTGEVVGEGGRNRQKQVDVQIAVDMLSHAHRKNMTYATLLTGDLDFKPLVDALVLNGLYVDLWCNKRSASKALIRSADSHRDLGIDELGQVVTDKLLEQHPIPHRGNQPAASRPNPPCCIARTQINKLIRVYTRADHWGYEAVIEGINGREDVILHPDLDFLKRYLEEKEGELQWSAE